MILSRRFFIARAGLAVAAAPFIVPYAKLMKVRELVETPTFRCVYCGADYGHSPACMRLFDNYNIFPGGSVSRARPLISDFRVPLSEYWQHLAQHFLPVA